MMCVGSEMFIRFSGTESLISKKNFILAKTD